MTTSLRRHDRRVLALQLIRRGLRTVPVRELTGLPDAEIRSLYRTIHGKSPPSGDVPCPASLFPTRRAQTRISLFAVLYRRIGGPGVYKEVDATALLQSHDLFRELTVATIGEMKDLLDFTGAWVIARALREGKALLNLCPDCRVRYLVAEDSDLPPTCPFCALRKERKRLRNRDDGNPATKTT